MSDIVVLVGGEVLRVADYPLPDGVEDCDDMSMADIAKAMNTSTVTIARWVDQGLPVAEKGGNGRAYKFRLSHCYAWRMWRSGKEAAEQAHRDAQASQLAMHFLGGEDQAPYAKQALTPKEMKDWAEAELRRNQASEQRGDLVRVGHVERMVEDLLITFRTALANFPDWVEQEFSLSPGQVEKVANFCDGVLTETRMRVGRANIRTPEIIAIGRDDMGAAAHD